MPDGHIIYYSHTALLPQDTPPIEARHAHFFPDLKIKALLSIGMFCDNGCLALFDNKKVHIIDRSTNKNIMHGTCENQSSLYMVPLTPKQNENMTEFNIPEQHFAGSLYESKSKSDLCTFLHIALWSPCTSTLISTFKKIPLHMARNHQTTIQKIPPKIRGNSKRAHLEIFQRKEINTS